MMSIKITPISPGAEFRKASTGLFAVPRLHRFGTHVFQEEFRNLHVEFVVFGQQHFQPVQSRFVRRAIRRRLRRGMLVDFKRQRHRKRRAFAEHAFHRDGAVHLLDELLHDRHAEARALILRAGALLFLV